MNISMNTSAHSSVRFLVHKLLRSSIAQESTHDPALKSAQNSTYNTHTSNIDTSKADIDYLHRTVDIFLITLISVNVLAVIFETVESFQTRYAVQFYWIEIISVSIFTVEYLLRVWSSVEDPRFRHHKTNFRKRLNYLHTPMALVDLIAILPIYLTFLGQMDLRFLRVLRLARIFKLTRYSGTMSTMLKVLREQSANFAAAIFIMVIIMVIAASGIYLVEHDDQPEVFGSIPESMWWALVTLTTVGYGDVVPMTLPGKFFAACIMIAGVGLVALPTGILASSFSEILKTNRVTVTKELQRAIENGDIDEQERKSIDELGQSLGLSEHTVAEIYHSVIEQNAHGTRTHINCPHCGNSLL